MAEHDSDPIEDEMEPGEPDFEDGDGDAGRETDRIEEEIEAGEPRDLEEAEEDEPPAEEPLDEEVEVEDEGEPEDATEDSPDELEDDAFEEDAGDDQDDQDDEDEDGYEEETDRPAAPLVQDAPYEPAASLDDEIPPIRVPDFKNMSVLEISSLVGVAVLLLAAGLALVFLWRGEVDAGRTEKPAFQLNSSVKGNHFTIASLDTYWKNTGPQDRVAAHQSVVPEILVHVENQQGGESAYLKVIFRDEKGTIRGDVAIREIRQGKFPDTNSPATTVYSTQGFMEQLDLLSMKAGNAEPWTVELYEGVTYGGGQWNRLAFVLIEPKLEDSRNPEN